MSEAPRWDMESIQPGGVASEDWVERKDDALKVMSSLVEQADALEDLPGGLEDWQAVLQALISNMQKIWQLGVIAHCQASTDTNDRLAEASSARITEIFALYGRAWVRIEEAVVNASEEDFESLAGLDALQDIRPSLDRIRAKAHLLLPPDQQGLVHLMSPDGINGWSGLYTKLSGRLEVTIDGETLSAGQAFNRTGAQDRSVRLAAHNALEGTWSVDKDTWATCLTHITGTRLTLNKLRDVGPLADTLSESRMKPETLNAMNLAIERFRPTLVEYLETKARVLGVEKLHWVDVKAPVGDAGPPHDWDTSSGFVTTHLDNAHSEMGEFTRMALKGRWIEAEDRPGKRMGGYCTWLPESKESRIFMTHGGRFQSTVTLAHELGHAFHNEVLRDVPVSRRSIPMTLAESASTFAENVVRDAALNTATSEAHRLALLDARLQAGVVFLMDIPARFAFELALYEMRTQGALSPDDLDAKMIECQKTAFGDALAQWSPTFWCSKLHFYIGSRSFYNFPYAFGYLFSALVYEQLKDGSAESLQTYRDLLIRTGWDHAENISNDILGLDLTNPDTWELAMQPIVRDLALYADLADNLS